MRTFILLLSASLVLGQEPAATPTEPKSAETPGPIVSTGYGKIQGSTASSRNGRMFYSFKGVQYGKVTERFQAPSIPDKWEDVRNATEDPPRCIQYKPCKKEVAGVEDCLNLNVFTPKLPMEGQDKVLLPVVVYLHSGLNTIGQNKNYDPKYFMDEDVILVIPNFRLGLFGFLSTSDMYAPGNAGLRDQVQALRWIQENIENFGGDKSRVTVFGSGSGGADAFIHTLSPLSKGLIHNAISMGGAPLSRTSFILNPRKQAKKLGTQLNCPVDSSKALVTCLKEKDAKEILEKMVKLDKEKLNIEEKAWFGITIDPVIEGQSEKDQVLPDNPVKLLKEGKISNKVPLIIGGNEFEGINPITAYVYKNESLLARLDSKFNDVAPKLFIYKDSAVDKDVVTSKLREFYFGDKPISRETFQNLTNLFMDRFMGFGMVAAAKLYSKQAPVYLYYFSHKPETTGLKFFGVENENFGMAHLDDVQYFFRIESKRLPFPEITKEHGEYQLSSNLVKLLSSFVETGKPSKVWPNAQEWPAIPEGDASKWFKIGMYTEVKSPAPEHLQKRIHFWQDLYKQQLAKEKETPVVEPF